MRATNQAHCQPGCQQLHFFSLGGIVPSQNYIADVTYAEITGAYRVLAGFQMTEIPDGTVGPRLSGHDIVTRTVYIATCMQCIT